MKPDTSLVNKTGHLDLSEADVELFECRFADRAFASRFG
jgi:hypothetical protein